MQIVVTGVNHATAPLPVRERLSVPEEQLAGALQELHAALGECFVLSTCNRVEVYAACGHEFTGAELLRRWIGGRVGMGAADVAASSYTRGHEAAALHAFRVAAGLDSMIVGEDQILGQMRRALGAARRAGTLGPILERLGCSALACGKRVRSEGALGPAAPSIVSVAIEAAVRGRGALAGARILVIGGGETASLALRHLKTLGPSSITVVGRSAERVAALALANDVEAAPWEAIPELLAAADVVLGCTTSARPVLTTGMIRSARQAVEAPLWCVDLGMPRNMEPGIAALPRLSLIDIDQLGSVAVSLRAARSHEIAAAEELVADEVERFMAWWRERAVAPAIARLHGHAHRIRAAELDRALQRLPGLSARDQEVIRALAERITSKLLHDPTIALKQDPEGANMAMMLDRLFRLSPDGNASAADDGVSSSHESFGDHG